MSLVEVKDLSVIRHRPLLQGVSFSMAESEFVSILGPNGAGKTTLLKAVLGLIPRSSGTVTLDSVPMETLSPRAVARLIGYVPQKLHVTFPFTVADFLRMNSYAAPWRNDSAKLHSAIDEMISLAGLQEYRERKITTLSGGEMQRVSLAAAAIQEPKILLLDEPGSSLDPKFNRALFDFLKVLQQARGVTVLAVSHDINAAAAHSTRILALKAGALAWTGSPQDLLQPATLEALYDAPFTRVDLPHAPGRAVVVVTDV